MSWCQARDTHQHTHANQKSKGYASSKEEIRVKSYTQNWKTSRKQEVIHKTEKQVKSKELYTKLKNKQTARSYTQNWETSKKQGVIHKTEKQAESKLYTKLRNK